MFDIKKKLSSLWSKVSFRAAVVATVLGLAVIWWLK